MTFLLVIESLTKLQELLEINWTTLVDILGSSFAVLGKGIQFQRMHHASDVTDVRKEPKRNEKCQAVEANWFLPGSQHIKKELRLAGLNVQIPEECQDLPVLPKRSNSNIFVCTKVTNDKVEIEYVMIQSNNKD